MAPIGLHKHNEQQVIWAGTTSFLYSTERMSVCGTYSISHLHNHAVLVKRTHTHTADPLGSLRRALGRQPSQQIGQDGGRAGGRRKAEMERYRGGRQKDEGLETTLHGEVRKSVSLDFGMKMLIWKWGKFVLVGPTPRSQGQSTACSCYCTTGDILIIKVFFLTLWISSLLWSV